MTTKEKTAIARILSDLIKADNIIELSEIVMFNKFKDTYNLDDKILRDACHIKFSDAAMCLQSLDNDEKVELFRNIQAMSLADGACVPKEALLLLALRYVLGLEIKPGVDEIKIDKKNNDTKIISCPTGDISISNQYVIYIESSYNESINNHIKNTIELNTLRLKNSGFDFVYIPALVKEFLEMDRGYVKNVVKYMAPELSDDTITTVYERLENMDTQTFCNYVLAENLKVDAVKNMSPSLFINIGNSVVPYCSDYGAVEYYTEFLCIPITKDFSSHVMEFLDYYGSIVSYYLSPNPVSNKDHKHKFMYFGFYKALFDFLIKAEPKESCLVIHPWNSVFSFPQVCIPDLRLSPQEAALYKLILEYTFNHKLHGLPTCYTKYQKEIEKQYCAIYHKSDAVYPDNLAPIKSKIESKMRRHLSDLANLEDYIPRLVDGKYVINAKADNIKISDSIDGEMCDFEGYKWKM